MLIFDDKSMNKNFFFLLFVNKSTFLNKKKNTKFIINQHFTFTFVNIQQLYSTLI